MDQGKVDLRVFSAVLERSEQFRVEPSQASELLSVDLVRLSAVGVDEPQPAGVGDQDLVTVSFEQTAHPRRMRARLNGDAHLFATGETPLEPLRAGWDAALLQDLAARGLQGTQLAVAITEVDADGDGRLGRHGWSSFRGSTLRSHDTPRRPHRRPMPGLLIPSDA